MFIVKMLVKILDEGEVLGVFVIFEVRSDECLGIISDNVKEG